MNFSSDLIEEAVHQFSKLPGIGKKTALRLVLHVLKQDVMHAQQLSSAIVNMRERIMYCEICFNVSDQSTCNICNNPSRNKNIICIVENIRDVMALEATQHYTGTYHVLGGLISPLDGIGPDSIHIPQLIQRIETHQPDEIVFALSPTIEGDTTSFYISKKIAHLPVKITAISRGIAFGGELEYADELTLARSLMNRVPLDQLVQKM